MIYEVEYLQLIRLDSSPRSQIEKLQHVEVLQTKNK